MQSIPAREHGPADNYPIQRIVMHGTVSPCVVGGARAIATMFHTSTRDASTQYVTDPATVVQCVPDSVIAYGAPPNKGSIHVEQCDPQAGPGSRWQDSAHQAMLHVAAKLVAGLCLKYDIPIRKIDAADLRAGVKGICGHADVTEAWHQTTHVDPGPDYPWAQFIGLVQSYAHPTPLPAKKGKRMYRLIRPGGSPHPIYVTDGMTIRWIRPAGAQTGTDTLSYYQALLRTYGYDDTVHNHDVTLVQSYGVLVGPDSPDSVIVWPAA